MIRIESAQKDQEALYAKRVNPRDRTKKSSLVEGYM
jgi:hypothetical protein